MESVALAIVGQSKQVELKIIQGRIASHVQNTLRAKPDWPCRKGCDHCCRHLAAIPRATQAEWTLVEEGLATLTPDKRQPVLDRVANLTEETRPVICPFLDRAAGACLIYDQRPIACRIYGFYVERDQGLYCGEIERRVNQGELQEIVWGNQASVAASLAELGEEIGLREWFHKKCAGAPGEASGTEGRTA